MAGIFSGRETNLQSGMLRGAPAGSLGSTEGGGGFELGLGIPVRALASIGAEMAALAAVSPADLSEVAADLPDVLSTIDWGTKLADPVIDVYFTPAGSYPDGVTDFGPSQGFTAYQKRQYFSALEQFSKATNLQFRETTSEALAEFRFGTCELDAYNALAFMVPPGDEYSGLMIFDPDYLGWLDEDSLNPLLSRGGFMYAVLLEEFAHGLGMAHPHDTGGSSTVLEGVEADIGSYGVGGLNQGVYTVMGYNEGWPGGPYGSAYYDGVWTYLNDFGYEAGPMALDVAVLQQKYGANLSWESGDSLYRLPQTNGFGTFYECIWDAGGSDTILAAAVGSARIDLRPATLRAEEGGGGYVSYMGGIRGGYTIAAGVVIENALGGPGSDTLIGNAAANDLQGRDGDDQIWGGSGHDSLGGGADRDLLHGERLDDTWDPASAQIVRLYKATLARWPDPSGHLGWTERLLQGTPLPDIATRFVASVEFQTRYGETSDTEFVTLLYNNVLDRGPDATGLAGWTALLDSGTTREEVVLGFSESVEFKFKSHAGAMGFSRAGFQQDWSDDVFRLYRAALDRAPDVVGLEGWTERLAEGVSFLCVVAGFTGSREFETRYGALDDADFVTLLYNNVLGREPDAIGMATWMDRLASGMSREEVVLGFSQSLEFQKASAAPLKAWMEARAPDDRIDGGSGDDVLFGGLFSDSFRFSRADGGRDVVADLEPWDRIELEGFGFASPDEAAAAFVAAGDDLVLSYDTGQIRLFGVQAGDIGAETFVII